MLRRLDSLDACAKVAIGPNPSHGKGREQPTKKKQENRKLAETVVLL
jgi:hypothetical protein